MTAMRWLQLFLDVPADRWAAALAFWPAATGGTLSAARGEDGQFVTLLPASGTPWVKLQRIPDAAARVHLDLDTVDRPRSIADALAAGASEAWVYHDVAVHRSPGGLTFCHTLAGPAPARLGRDGDVVLDQVCLDVPPARWDAELAFWSAVTGRTPERGARPEFVRLLDPDDPAGAPRILAQRLDEDAPAVGTHPDLAVADRPAATVRHRALGAELLAEREHWTVLRAPSGHAYCLTDRNPATGSV